MKAKSSQHSETEPGSRSMLRFTTSRAAKFTAAALCLCGLALVYWSGAQVTQWQDRISQRLGEPDEPTAIRAVRELDRLALIDPVGFEKEVNKRKTPEDLQQEQIAVFSICQPAAYSAELEPFKDAARKQKERQARAAILDPVKHSGPPPKGHKPTP